MVEVPWECSAGNLRPAPNSDLNAGMDVTNWMAVSWDRHSPDWYDQSGEIVALNPGDRMLIACEGGPCQSRLETFPPRLEIEERDGVYVLTDDGPIYRWRYIFQGSPGE